MMIGSNARGNLVIVVLKRSMFFGGRTQCQLLSDNGATRQSFCRTWACGFEEWLKSSLFELQRFCDETRSKGSPYCHLFEDGQLSDHYRKCLYRLSHCYIVMAICWTSCVIHGWSGISGCAEISDKQGIKTCWNWGHLKAEWIYSDKKPRKFEFTDKSSFQSIQEDCSL